MVYTTTANVSAELGGITIDGSSTPTATTVDSWIADAKAEIDERSGTTFESTAITSSDYEYHDYDGEGYIFTKKFPIISVESVEFETKGLGAPAASWVELTEGRTEDENFIVYKDLGVIKFHSSRLTAQPIVGMQNCRLEYTHGYSSVPANVTRLATLLVAQRYLTTVASKTASEEGGSVTVGTISVSDPTNYANARLKQYDAEIKQLFADLVGTLKITHHTERIFA